MPTFSKLEDVEVCEVVEVDVDIDVSVEEFYQEMDYDECEEMVKLLQKKGFTNVIETGGRGMDAAEFEEAIEKLVKNYHCLPKEQTDLIISLAKRF